MADTAAFCFVIKVIFDLWISNIVALNKNKQINLIHISCPWFLKRNFNIIKQRSYLIISPRDTTNYWIINMCGFACCFRSWVKLLTYQFFQKFSKMKIRNMHNRVISCWTSWPLDDIDIIKQMSISIIFLIFSYFKVLNKLLCKCYMHYLSLHP